MKSPAVRRLVGKGVDAQPVLGHDRGRLCFGIGRSLLELAWLAMMNSLLMMEDNVLSEMATLESSRWLVVHQTGDERNIVSGYGSVRGSQASSEKH
jgi:hypothetical protein